MSKTNPIRTLTPHFFKNNFTVPSHLLSNLCFQSGCFLLGLPTKILLFTFISPMRATSLARFILLQFIILLRGLYCEEICSWNVCFYIYLYRYTLTVHTKYLFHCFCFIVSVISRNCRGETHTGRKGRLINTGLEQPAVTKC